MLRNLHVLLTFDTVHNPLRLPRGTRSERPKVVRQWCVLYILTSKCASSHNGVHFFDISTSKSGPSMVWFVHFVFEMRFVPQRRAFFQHLNFQKWSGLGVALAPPRRSDGSGLGVACACAVGRSETLLQVLTVLSVLGVLGV